MCVYAYNDTDSTFNQLTTNEFHIKGEIWFSYVSEHTDKYLFTNIRGRRESSLSFSLSHFIIFFSFYFWYHGSQEIPKQSFRIAKMVHCGSLGVTAVCLKPRYEHACTLGCLFLRKALRKTSPFLEMKRWGGGKAFIYTSSSATERSFRNPRFAFRINSH